MKKIVVMIAGLPGKMATLVANAIALQGDMELCSSALAEEVGTMDIPKVGMIFLIPSYLHTNILRERRDINVVVDFTQPKSVNRNADLYCATGVPFIMGTTGGNREALVEAVERSNISAVIAPNMAVPVVIFQAMIKYAAENFPGAFEGFKLVIEESHQATKADVSGTAVSLLDSFAALGMPLKKEQIRFERDPVVQEVMLGIPKQYLTGHGYHTYTMLSPDGTMFLQFTHNLLGRSAYADGVLKDIRFLAKNKDVRGKVFSQSDALRG